jgi:mannose-1-phosphate guanylyltransferase
MKEMNCLCPVVMAGGSGSRLWPLSRQLKPKQFLALSDHQQTMLQETLARLKNLPDVQMAQPLLICNEEHRFLAAEQMRSMGYEHANVILEPVGRNTAPAVALAALHIQQHSQDPNPLMLVLAADHHIADVEAFHVAVGQAVNLARAGKLVTFGVVPTHAETGYGYIEKGLNLNASGFAVSRFVEKPDAATAQVYLDSGRYLWNSGMFVLSVKSYLDELATHAPDILEACRAALVAGSDDFDFTRVGKVEFAACRDESIDYAVMEKTQHAAVVPLDAGWSDVGSWSSLWNVCPQDAEGNVVRGDVFLENTQQSYIHSDGRLVAAVGLQDVVIIDTADALLVAHKNSVQDVKKIVDRLKAEGRTEHINHREVYRPWGKYDSIDSGSRYQVKRITVKPGAKLSVQMHHHRAEHWIVVSGTAKVTNGDKTYLVAENESTYIPIGQVHALENPGKIDLEMIEVQSGSYLGEDDIVRFEDRYGRH